MVRTSEAVLVALVAVVAGCGGAGPSERAVVVQRARPDPAAPVRLESGDGSFGSAVAASADVVAVAATGSVPGSVDVFERGPAGWTHAAKLSAPGRTEGDWSGWFGRGLAVGSGLVAVGAPWSPGGGRVYVFRRDAVGWQLEAELTPSIDTAQAFGRALALDGTTLLVGAPEGADGGTVFVFERGSAGWAEVGRLAPEEPLGYDEFGFAVATSNGVAVVGAPRTSLGPWATEGDTAGAAYVFVRTASGWRQETVIQEPALEYAGSFGLSVAAADGVIVISCGCPDGDAYVYELTGGAWTLAATLQPGWTTEGTLFGHEVAVSNGYAFVAAPFAEPSGVVLRWRRNGSRWVADGELSIPGAEPGLQAGHALAAAGELVVVGAPRHWEATAASWMFPRGAH